MSDIQHGMVLVPILLDGIFERGRQAIAVTCMCGWFDDKVQNKIDMAVLQWHMHMEDNDE